MDAVTQPMMTVKERLRDGQLVRVFAVGLIGEPKIVEIAALHGGYHSILIDQEHAALPFAQLEHVLRACRLARLESLVRLAPVDYASVMRPLEAGACGVLFAQVRHLQQIHQLIRWTKLFPEGQRRLFPGNFESSYGMNFAQDTIESSNREGWLGVQIDNEDVLMNIEEIAAVEEVDHFFLDPSGLSLSLGVPGEYLNERFLGALEVVARTAEVFGKNWGTIVVNPEFATLCRNAGCQLFVMASELSVLHTGFQATQLQYSWLFQENLPPHAQDHSYPY